MEREFAGEKSLRPLLAGRRSALGVAAAPAAATTTAPTLGCPAVRARLPVLLLGRHLALTVRTLLAALSRALPARGLHPARLGAGCSLAALVARATRALRRLLLGLGLAASGL